MKAYNLLTSEDDKDFNATLLEFQSANEAQNLYGLLFKDRLSSKDNLSHKNITENSFYPRYDVAFKDALHNFIHHRRLPQVWLDLGLTCTLSIARIWDMDTSCRPRLVDFNIAPSVVHPGLWKI